MSEQKNANNDRLNDGGSQANVRVERLVMPTDLKITGYPDQKQFGMSVPNLSKGIKVEHIPTGNIVVCMHHTSQHKNKETAIAVLELMLEA